MAILSDLNVTQLSPDCYVVSSHLTRGPCANVYDRDYSEYLLVVPLFTSQYMQGITTDMIVQAVEQFKDSQKV